MIEFITRGGPVMWPIVLLAIISIAIIIERGIYFFITSFSYGEFVKLLENDMNPLTDENIPVFIAETGRSNRAARISAIPPSLRAYKMKSNPFSRITSVYFEKLTLDPELQKDILRRTGSEEIEKMENRLWGLSAVSHIAPLLGLLGTVTGIISCFAAISNSGGQADVSALAGGIWEAMVTTAAGLIVAIPSQLAYLYFEKVVSKRENGMSYVVSMLDEYFYSDSTNRKYHPYDGGVVIKGAEASGEYI